MCGNFSHVNEKRSGSDLFIPAQHAESVAKLTIESWEFSKSDDLKKQLLVILKKSNNCL